MTVLWIKGLPNDKRVSAWVDQRGSVKMSTGGSINMFDAAGRDFEGIQVILPRRAGAIKRPALVVNEISNPESQSDALKEAAKLCGQIERPVINRPERVLQTTREIVGSRLRGLPQLLVPRVLLIHPRTPDEVFQHAESNNLGFPFIVRETGTHGGATMLLIRSAADQGMLHQLRFDGRGMHLIEYVDFRDADGVYRKYRFVMVDGQPFIRHALLNDHWMVHASAYRKMEGRADWLDLEMSALADFETQLKPRVVAALEAIDQKLGLDYWGVDCNLMDDGRLLVFEANCNMNITINSRKNKSLTQLYIDKIVSAFADMVRARLEQSA